MTMFLYYYLNSQINILHSDYVILKSFLKWKNNENMYNYNVLWVLLNSLYSLNSFQFFSHVTVIYLKHFHVNTLQTYNLSINFETKTWKTKHSLQQNVSMYTKWFHWILNEFIGLSEQNLMRMYWIHYSSERIVNCIYIL
jgi:hypothetical protein